MRGKNPLSIIWRLISQMQKRAAGRIRRVEAVRQGKKARKGTLSPWEILEIEPGASEEEIQRGLQTPTRQVPSGPGEPPGGRNSRTSLTGKTLQIRQAYETVSQSRR